MSAELKRGRRRRSLLESVAVGCCAGLGKWIVRDAGGCGRTPLPRSITYNRVEVGIPAAAVCNCWIPKVPRLFL